MSSDETLRIVYQQEDTETFVPEGTKSGVGDDKQACLRSGGSKRVCMGEGSQMGTGVEGMERLVGVKKDFKIDTELNWKPVKVDEGGGDVLPGLGAGEKPGSCGLDILEPVQGFAGNPDRQDVIKTLMRVFCPRVGQWGPESGDIFKI